VNALAAYVGLHAALSLWPPRAARGSVCRLGRTRKCEPKPLDLVGESIPSREPHRTAGFNSADMAVPGQCVSLGKRRGLILLGRDGASASAARASSC